MHDDLNAWALILTPGGTLIAKINHPDCRTHLEDGPLELHEFYELNAGVSMTPQGVQKTVVAMPFMVTELGAPMTVKPFGIQYLKDMQPKDKDRYKKLIEAAKHHSEKTRAGDSGLTLARLIKE